MYVLIYDQITILKGTYYDKELVYPTDIDSDVFILMLKSTVLLPSFLEKNNKKIQVGKDQEKAQSEKDSHSKNQGGKKTKITIKYLYHESST